MFSIISSISILFLTALLIYHRYKKQKKVSSFSSWFINGLASPFRSPLIKQFKISYQKYIRSTVSQTEQILLGGLFFCFVYLFVSGFSFSLFSTHRMFGLPLLFHVSLGCLFAVLLCVLLILHAKNFDFLDQKNGKEHKLLVKAKNILFWLFVLSGLSLITSSLLMMIPIFIYQTQLVLFEIHRYSALVSVLTAVGFFYAFFSENEKP
ncbi:MAG: hypothetical protein ACOC5S_00580 [Acidobacteriota bacterium]